MRNRAILVTAVFLLAVMTLSSFAGCEHGSRSKLIATETTTETTETETVATTTTETTVETTAETAETTVEETVEETETMMPTEETTVPTKKVTTTKPTSKTSGSSSKPSTTKPKTTTKAPTKKPAATKTPTKKPTTKPVVKPKTTKTPTKAPTPVPSKGYAMVKFQFNVTMRDKDENGNYIKHSFTKIIKCVTTNYHSTKKGDYHVCDGDITYKVVKAEVGSNYRNYSASKVKVVEFLN